MMSEAARTPAVAREPAQPRQAPRPAAQGGESIGQKLDAPRLPDFRNLGVMLRALVVVNLLMLCAVLLRNESLMRLPQELLELAARVEPPLLAALALGALLAPALARLPYGLGASAVAALAAGAAMAFSLLLAPLHADDGTATWRSGFWALLAAAVCLGYFEWRARRFSPALAEARLQALTARIRPHFFFNSLNAVLGVIRADPRRAESALESLADLFRALMADNRQLTALADEIDLCERYLDLERLRLGERLRIDWHLLGDAGAALVPPLMLQPLIENAVYHGVEPSPTPAVVRVTIARSGAELALEIANPYHGEGAHPSGNRMALANIRERLMLFYDLEARLDTEIAEGEHRVRIRLPYRERSAT